MTTETKRDTIQALEQMLRKRHGSGRRCIVCKSTRQPAVMVLACSPRIAHIVCRNCYHESTVDV